MKNPRLTTQNRIVVIGNQCTRGSNIESLTAFFLPREIDGLLRNSRQSHSPLGTLASLSELLFDRQYGWRCHQDLFSPPIFKFNGKLKSFPKDLYCFHFDMKSTDS
ncbi:hypothetical protein TNCT_149541 [Trichonephila clavata]|uniref:Uncharacterized protein n=1 Tax=Trichonephila clavata TaxID=2740835 RepID=A0A8X6G638_TRICU|nr:hypothetical protein TNCT_149541 [Trichonephila clavata]